MVFQTKLTVEEFDQFVELPENADRLFEFIGGEIVEVPSNSYASLVGSIILGELYIYLKTTGLGYLTGEAGGYKVSGERYAPDVGFISKHKPVSKKGYNVVPPDLAVEVDFPSTAASREQLITKIINYLAAGTVVWRAIPELKQLRVYIPGEPEKILTVDDVLDGGDVLPGFTLPVSMIFPDIPDE